MKTFKDNAGRTWTLAVHVTAVKRCRALVNVDLMGLVNEGFGGLGKLLCDPISLVDVLYVLCKEDADKANVSDEDFGRAMAGDAIEHATAAFLEEFAAFFPDPRVRAGITRVIEKGRKVADRILEHQRTVIDAIDPDDEARKSIASSGGSPESSGSTPDPSPSANST